MYVCPPTNYFGGVCHYCAHVLNPVLLCRNVGGNGNNDDEYTVDMICFTISVCLGGSGTGNNNGNGDNAGNGDNEGSGGSKDGSGGGGGGKLEGLSAIVGWGGGGGV